MCTFNNNNKCKYLKLVHTANIVILLVDQDVYGLSVILYTIQPYRILYMYLLSDNRYLSRIEKTLFFSISTKTSLEFGSTLQCARQYC